MAVTITTEEFGNIEGTNAILAYGTITGDTSYPTGGYAFATTGIQNVRAVTFGGAVGGFAPGYNASTGKVQLFGSNGAAPAALAEIANTTNVSTFTVPYIAIGS